MNELENFKIEVSQMITSDIALILDDQVDLYSDEEIKILKAEYEKRLKTKEKYDTNLDKIYAEFEEEELEYEQKEREEMYQEKIKKLKEKGYTEYNEYTILNIFDDKNGLIDVDDMLEKMNDLALDGWKLVSTLTNELGKNTSSIGISGIVSGVNATIEQNILIFERKIKI